MTGLDILFDNPALGLMFEEGEDPTPPPPATNEPQPVPATVDVKEETMRVMTCNVQNTPDLPRNKVIKAGKQVSGHFTVCGFQELGENGEDRSDVLAGLGPDYTMTAHGPAWVQEQIAYKKDSYTLGQGGWVQAVAGGQPYPNPPRGWTWQEFTTHGNLTFLFVDAHFVNKAFNDEPDPHKQLRRQNWKLHYEALALWLKPRVRALPTIVVGDFNRLDVKPFTVNMRVLAANGIDKLFIGLPEGWRVKAGQPFSIHTTSDHPAVGKELTLERKRAS